MNIKRFEHGGNIYSAQRKTGQKPVLDFSANINPLGLSLKVREAIVQNIDNVVHYPDANAYDLKKEISSYYGINEDMLVLGNGATELLYLLCHVLRPAKVFLPAPCFSEYERAALSVGAIIEYFYLDSTKDFVIDYDAILRAMPNNSMLFLGNPNNPTGKLLAINNFSDFAQKAKEKNCQIVLDESFIDFLPKDKELTLRDYCLKYENLFLLHSMTKFFAIPGLRLGFGVFPNALAERLRQATDCWNVNNLAQAAGCAGLQDIEYIEKSKTFVSESRQNFVKQLSVFEDIKVFESSVNFLLLDISKTKLSSDEFCQLMAKQGVLIRNCANYPGLGDSYVRIAVRTINENIHFIEVLKKVREQCNG